MYRTGLEWESSTSPVDALTAIRYIQNWNDRTLNYNKWVMINKPLSISSSEVGWEPEHSGAVEASHPSIVMHGVLHR
jgi:hypothetical protein